ncbi:uncharacterized protein LOC117225180 [Megalopta genalis]|uniref:uncharacterized protein LOC117225180 n=1 Tax=Megalopta genalis TaxID=115081 RepID=UPI003FCF6E4C
MARVYVYERPVDAVSTNESFYEKLNYVTTALQIKQEPISTDDNCQDSTLPLADINTNTTTVTGETIVRETQLWNNVNNQENELVLSKHRNDTDLSGTNVVNTQKRKCLAFENFEVSEKKLGVGLKSPESIEATIESDVCFLNFKSLMASKVHTDYQTDGALPFCNKYHTICKSAHFLDEQKWMRRCKIKTKVSFCCRFCTAKYRTKSNLKCHVFHNHSKLLPFSAEKADNHSETDKSSKIKKIKTDETNETDKLSENCETRETREIDKTSKMQLTENTDNYVTSPSVHQNGNDKIDPSPTKMKQTTITQFLSEYTRITEDFCPNKVRNPKKTLKKVIPRQNKTLTEKIDHYVETPKIAIPSQMKTILEASEPQGEGRRKIVTRRSGTTREKVNLHLKTQEKITRQSGTVVKSLSTLTNEKTLITTESSTPNGSTTEENSSFVKIHIGCDMMKALLNKIIKTELKAEPCHFALENHNLQRVTRSSLRRSLNDLNTTPVIKSPKRIRFRKRAASTPKEKAEHQSTEKELRAKFKCKNLKLNLVRCDMVVKTETVDVTQISVEGDEKIAEMWQKKVTLNRENAPLVKVNELIKVEVKEPFLCSEVSNAHRDNTKANSRILFRCKACKKCFPIKKNLRKHFELRHVFFKSSICDAKCKTKFELQKHYMNKHSGFKRMQCCVCLKKFSSLVMLKQHLRLHCTQVLLPKRKKQCIKEVIKCRMPDKKCSCKACGKRFWLKSCLKEHQKLCTKMRGREKQSQNVSNTVETSTKRVLDDANIKLNAPQSKLCLINEYSNGAISPPMKQTKMLLRGTTFAKGYTIDYSGVNKNTFDCTTCNKHFRTFRNLCMHEQTYSKAATHVCTICNTAFSTRTLLHRHHQFTHTFKTLTKHKYFCTFCTQGFRKKMKIQIHTRHFHAGHTPIIPIPWLECTEDWEVSTICSVCKLEFNSNEQFIQHNMFYYKGQIFTCAFCSKTFQGLYMLHSHIKSEHNTEDVKKQYTFTCDICNEGFIIESHCHAHKLHVHSMLHETSQYLQDHAYVSAANGMESTNGPIPKYNCNICHMIFIAEEDLHQHKMEYTNDGNYFCSFCTRKCLTDVILSKHVSSSHTCFNFIDCYQCHYCNEVLPSYTELKSHKIHFHPEMSGSQHDCSNQIIANQTTEAPEDIANTFSCTICDTKFECLEKLKYHSMAYSTEGLYNCHVCNRHFQKLNHLEVHMLRHTNLHFILSKYHCPVCREGFTNQVNVRIHVMHLHPSTPIEKPLTSDAQNTQKFN